MSLVSKYKSKVVKFKKELQEWLIDEGFSLGINGKDKPIGLPRPPNILVAPAWSHGSSMTIMVTPMKAMLFSYSDGKWEKLDVLCYEGFGELKKILTNWCFYPLGSWEE